MLAEFTLIVLRNEIFGECRGNFYPLSFLYLQTLTHPEHTMKCSEAGWGGYFHPHDWLLVCLAWSGVLQTCRRDTEGCKSQ